VDFNKRSYQKELLDRNDIPFRDIRQNMKELNTINTYLGGHAITIKGLKKLIGNKKNITICEIGCGGGDNLKAINDWCKKKKITTRLIGIDINADCIAVAQETLSSCQTELLTADYTTISWTATPPDIIFSSLFCHHFTEQELEWMLKWMQGNARMGFFINDLHRHPLAYYSIKFITRLFSKSYLVKNDAPLSVQRGFSKAEWKTLLTQSGIANAIIRWKWAFRWLIVVKPPQ
jgi:2-polyprenyl-3-methyl-5-hydroxy-6-metoxy-1,4-benzoquinol methylase